MNRHGRAALTRLAKAGVALTLPADADVVIRLHELGQAVDAVRTTDDEAVLMPCIESHGLTFWRLSIAARRFLIDDVFPATRNDAEAFLGRLWAMSLDRRAEAFAPYRDRPRAIRRAIKRFARSCPLSEGELVEIMNRLDPQPESDPADKSEARDPADIPTMVEALQKETGLPVSYWVFEASEQMIGVLIARMRERHRREQVGRGRAVAEDAGTRFGRARKRLMDYELEVRTARGGGQTKGRGS